LKNNLLIKYLFLVLLLVVGCSKDDGLKIYHLTGPTMGTTYNVKFIAPTGYDEKSIAEDITIRLKAVNQAMSTYIKDSEISLLNKEKANVETKISKDFFHVLSHSISVSDKTSGVFDPTIGPLVNLWGFGPDGKRKVPAPEKLTHALSLVGHDKLSLNKQEMSVRKSLDEVYVDLSASAKGFGVDALVELIKSRGIDNAMVEVGGEVRTIGKSLTRAWKIGIEAPHPNNPSEIYTKIIQVQDFALATSGDYRNFFEQDGKKYQHTIDFKTGRPVEGVLASVSVISDTCMDADAWATAFMAMGTEKGYQFAVAHGMKAFFIYRSDKTDQNGARIYMHRSTKEFDTIVK